MKNKHKILNKAWGHEEIVCNEKEYCGKLLYLNEGYQCSRHYHKIKKETFFILQGKVLLEVNDKRIILKPGESVTLEPGTWHRFRGLGDGVLSKDCSIIIEFSMHHCGCDSYRDPEQLSGKVEE